MKTHIKTQDAQKNVHIPSLFVCFEFFDHLSHFIFCFS